MENVYVFKNYEAIMIVKEFLNKGWRLWRLNKLSKKLQELARRQDEAAAFKHTEYLLVFYCVIFIHKLGIMRKE